MVKLIWIEIVVVSAMAFLFSFLLGYTSFNDLGIHYTFVVLGALGVVYSLYQYYHSARERLQTAKNDEKPWHLLD